MKNEKKKCMKVNKMLLVLLFMIVLVSLASCSDNKSFEANNILMASAENQSNQDIGSNSFDVSVNINYRITLDYKVKDVDPNIIKAARQGIFDYDISNARHFHYNYSMSMDIYIFQVDQTDKNTWSVRFWEKPQGPDSYTYDKNVFCAVVVKRLATGSFIGYEFNPGGPDIGIGETD